MNNPLSPVEALQRELALLKARNSQLEKNWPAGHGMPPQLTAAEYAGAPVSPGRNWNLRGPPLCEAAWKSVNDNYEKSMLEWLAGHPEFNEDGGYAK